MFGILNVTPDSFSDGGQFDDVRRAVHHGRTLARAGATVLDVGGESTRPHADPVSVEEELRRVVPVVRALREEVGLPISVDTRRAAVFAEAWDAGADLLNDVSGLVDDPGMIPAVARTDAAVIVMHRRGDPATMDRLATYQDVVGDVARELTERVTAVRQGGVEDDRIVVDPGLGFAKDAEQSWTLLASLDRLRCGAHPLLIGASRKRFLGTVTGREAPTDRDVATATLSALLVAEGVEALRVHHVPSTVDAIAVARRFQAARSEAVS